MEWQADGIDEIRDVGGLPVERDQTVSVSLFLLFFLSHPPVLSCPRSVLRRRKKNKKQPLNLPEPGTEQSFIVQ